VSVYVNNWCGADGEQSSDRSPAAAAEYSTLPAHYQRCLQHQRQQQACLGAAGHYHTVGQRHQLMYETVGRARDGVEGAARAMLCSRHGRSNSLSPGRARYAAGQLCTAARLRRPLMMPAVDNEVAAATTGGAATDLADQAATSSSAAASPLAAEQPSAASCTVDDASTDASHEAQNPEASEPATVEPPNDAVDQLGGVPLSDNVDPDTEHPEPPADVEQSSITVTDSRGMPNDEEPCTEKSANDNDHDVFEVKAEPGENDKETSSVEMLEVATAKKDNERSVATNDVVVNGGDTDLVPGEICSKDWTAAQGGNEWSSKPPPMISFDQTDTTLAKFDSSALEKILNSLSATSLRDLHDGPKTNDDHHHDEEVWMRHDVVDDACQSSLSMLDAAAAQLDDGQHFKSRRRRSSSASSSSSSSSVGHCSPSCLISHSTVDADTDITTQLLFTGVSKSPARVDNSTNATAATSAASITSANLHSTPTSLEPAAVEERSLINGWFETDDWIVQLTHGLKQ